MQEKYPGLEIEEDFAQQEREWALHRVAWPLLFVLLFAIILGLFGKGPLIRAELNTPNQSLHIEYHRFIRYGSPDNVRLSFKTTGNTSRIKISNKYLAAVRIEKITPEPEKIISGSNATIFVFNVLADEQAHAQFNFKPQSIGNLEGWIALDQGEKQVFHQFAYP